MIPVDTQKGVSLGIWDMLSLTQIRYEFKPFIRLCDLVNYHRHLHGCFLLQGPSGVESLVALSFLESIQVQIAVQQYDKKKENDKN